MNNAFDIRKLLGTVCKSVTLLGVATLAEVPRIPLLGDAQEVETKADDGGLLCVQRII